jgi:hypothetical protein
MKHNPLVRARFASTALVLAACSAPASRATHISAPSAADPRKAEVSLPAEGGWRATLVLDNGPTAGVWTVGVHKVFAQYACPEIVGIDDLGRCHVLWSYSGKWTPVTTIADGKWLGGIAWADVDGRVDGRELYTGSQQGNLYEVVPYRNTLLDNRLIGTIPGREIHTVVAADVDAAHAGLEVLVFTSPGGLYVAAPRADGRDGFDVRLVADLPGRIRDALVLEDGLRAPAEIATIGRHGKLEILRWQGGAPVWETVFETAMGLGRVARKQSEPHAPLVLYSTADDGMIRRHERGAAGAWTHTVVYVGPPGPRGVCAGRFDADPAVETLAVFGYSKEVELLSRRGAAWTRETVFVDRDKGHWVATGEVDGRNGTDEIVCSGYSGRIALLARPPGYGLDMAGAAVAP